MGFMGTLKNLFTAPARERTLSIKKQLRDQSSRPRRLVAGNTVMGSRNTMTGQQFYNGLPGLPNALNLDHWSLRHNVRNLMFSGGPAKAIVNRFAQFEASTGLRLQVSPKAELLGISKEEAEKWGRDFAARFHLWAENKGCSLDGHHNLYEGQFFYSVQDHRDTDIFIRLHYSKDSRLLNPLQFQFLDPDQIDGDAVTTTDGRYPNLDHPPGTIPMDGIYRDMSNRPGHVPMDGIYRDKNGKETAYRVILVTHHNHTKSTTIKRYTANGMVKMIHAYRREFPGQRRGIPEMSAAIQTFSGLTGFTIAQIQKAINQSNFAFYTKPSDEADASNPLEVELEARGPRPSDYIGTEPTEADEISDGDVLDYTLLPEFNVSQPGSLWVTTMKKGEEVVPIENTAPADRFDSFVNAFVTNLASDNNMPVEVLLMKFGQNYSASRATLMLFWQIIELGRHNMAWDFLNVLVDMWATGEIAAGRIKAPGWSNPIVRQAWLQLRWIGTPMPEIDPFKAAKAAKERAELGHETLDDGALNHNSSDGRANRAQLTKEFEELPIAPWSQAAQQEDSAGATDEGGSSGATSGSEKETENE